MRGNKLLSLRRKRSCDPFATSKRQEQLRLTSLVTLFEQAWSASLLQYFFMEADKIA
jgi:hypothetical protein